MTTRTCDRCRFWELHEAGAHVPDQRRACVALPAEARIVGMPPGLGPSIRLREVPVLTRPDNTCRRWEPAEA